MNLNDSRIPTALAELGYSDAAEISQSDYEKLEDNLIALAAELVQSDEQLAALKAAGFDSLANALQPMTDAVKAYDWARENL